MSLDTEIERRRPVWLALSDLFLDTDVRISYPYVACTLAKSPFSIEELRVILDDEVTPVVQGNLLSVAGEWAGLDDKWLVAEMSQRIGKPRWTPLLINMDREWNAVARMAEILRGLGAEATPGRTKAWNTLMPLILRRKAQLNDLSGVAGLSIAELESIFRNELCAVLLHDARELAQSEPEIYPDEQEIESNWRNFAGA